MGFGTLHSAKFAARHGASHLGALLLGAGGPPPDVEVETQLEPLNGQQLTAHLGFGIESIWKALYLFNESASPANPQIGTGPMSTVTGTPTYGAAGPLDSFDKGISFTDGQVASVASGNGVVTFGAQDWAVLVEVSFTSLPAANRFIIGHDGTEDCFLQYMATTGNIRAVVLGGTIGTVTASVATNHNNGASHTVLLVGINGANMKLTTEMGTSGNVSIATEAAFDFTSVWRAGASNAFPGTISLCAVAISDGSPEEDTAIADLFTNATTAVANYRTATGR